MKTLFMKADLFDFLRKRQQEALHNVNSISEDQVLSIPEEDLVLSVLDKYRLEPLKLKVEEGTVESDSMNMPHGDPQSLARQMGLRSGPTMGEVVRFYIPFNGEAKLFDLKPSTWQSSAPAAEVKGTELVLSLSGQKVDINKAKQQRDELIKDVTKYIEWSTADVSKYNAELESVIRGSLKHRKAKTLERCQQVESLGLKPRRKDNAPTTYKLPEVRRTITPIATKKTSKFEPEPELDKEEYEHILDVCFNMARVMEQSPKAFEAISEPDLRMHFLVQLNGHYEGMATGETFNLEGKTDIVIKEGGGGNVFIAECKYWEGEAAFSEAIDQLLGYISWRDTKTALLVFNRKKDFSAVLEKADKATQEHSHFKRRISEYKHESGFRYVFGNKNDEAKEFVLTVLVFGVPVKGS